ncbi:hypothetical protein Syncc9902_0090 [Synechococcus sp. CC9902]|uniref:sulfotransferase family 2 domain-containing protein n=1 Tax=Synechococcus sp. (strain CC9902) TaxID=316279 RepID=UPI00005D3CF3|nr:hypothetical protein Syncc9902_0090 [Synechococcus sp. CC9902]
MISHKYKCIFLHIPGTAGTLIERLIVGQDWYNIDPNSKHLNYKQSKQLYRDYWDHYFKFTWIRNPSDRLLSLTRFPNAYFNIQKFDADYLSEENIYQYYNYCRSHMNISSEYPLRELREISVYEDFLGEDFDFVGRFDKLNLDIKVLLNLLNISTCGISQIIHSISISTPKSRNKRLLRYNKSSLQLFRSLFLPDYLLFESFK